MSQRRTLLDLRDILALEYECKHCHVRYSVQIANIDRAIAGCPNCREQWLIEQQTPQKELSDSDVVYQVISAVKRLKSRTLGAVIRFEVTNPESG